MDSVPLGVQGLAPRGRCLRGATRVCSSSTRPPRWRRATARAPNAGARTTGSFVTLWHELHPGDGRAPTRSTRGCTPSGVDPGGARAAPPRGAVRRPPGRGVRRCTTTRRMPRARRRGCSRWTPGRLRATRGRGRAGAADRAHAAVARRGAARRAGRAPCRSCIRRREPRRRLKPVTPRNGWRAACAALSPCTDRAHHGPPSRRRAAGACASRAPSRRAQRAPPAGASIPPAPRPRRCRPCPACRAQLPEPAAAAPAPSTSIAADDDRECDRRAMRAARLPARPR